MLKKILVAMDFSPAWPQLRQRLLTLREWGADSLVLVHVLSSRYPAVPEEGHREHYQQTLNNEAEALQQLGFQVHVELRVGEPGSELVAASQAHDCEALLLGSSGHGHIHEFLLGSTVLDVARLTCRPLWLEPIGKQARGSDGGALLLATDGSPAATAAEAWFAWLRPHFSKAIAMTVIGHGSGEGREREDLEQHLKLLGQDIPDVQIRIEQGHAQRRISALAEGLPAALTIIGKRGRNALQDLLMGSTAEGVCRATRLPVLLVPGCSTPAS